jgi:hypothetical protein
MTGIEPAWPAWKTLSVCYAGYARIADVARDLGVASWFEASLGVEILVESHPLREALLSRGAQCSIVRIREDVASAERGPG